MNKNYDKEIAFLDNIIIDLKTKKEKTQKSINKINNFKYQNFSDIINLEKNLDILIQKYDFFKKKEIKINDVVNNLNLNLKDKIFEIFDIKKKIKDKKLFLISKKNRVYKNINLTSLLLKKKNLLSKVKKNNSECNDNIQKIKNELIDIEKIDKTKKKINEDYINNKTKILDLIDKHQKILKINKDKKFFNCDLKKKEIEILNLSLISQYKKYKNLILKIDEDTDKQKNNNLNKIRFYEIKNELKNTNIKMIINLINQEYKIRLNHNKFIKEELKEFEKILDKKNFEIGQIEIKILQNDNLQNLKNKINILENEITYQKNRINNIKIFYKNRESNIIFLNQNKIFRLENKIKKINILIEEHNNRKNKIINLINNFKNN